MAKTTDFSTDLYNPSYILEKMFLGNQAIEKGAIFALEKPNYSSSFVVPRIDVSSNNLQKYSPTPTDSKGFEVYDEKKFELKEFMLYREFNPRSYEDIWEQYRMRGRRIDKMMNPTLQARIVSLFIKSINEQMGRVIWQGDSSSLDATINLFDGILKRVDADGDVIDTVSQGAITTGNVFSILEAMYNDIPDTVLEATDLKFHMSTADWKIYGQALKTLDFKGGDLRDALATSYKGIEIVHFSGMPKDRILCAVSSNTNSSNLFLGLESLNDITDILIDKTSAKDDIWFMKAVSNADCQIGFGSEIVNYEA